MKKFKKIYMAGIALAALSIGAIATGQVGQAYSTPQPVVSSFSDPQNVEYDLTRLDGALNSITNFEGRFTQYTSDGQIDTGIIHLSRPGRMRFEYDAPNPLLVVSDGVTLVQHDKALETTDRVPLSATPLNYFLKENVNLARDTEVVGLLKTPQEIRVTARDGSGEMDGDISMIFDPQTLAFKAWVIADSFGGETRVVLSDLRYNGNVDPRIFIHRDEDRRDRRRR